VGSPQADGQQRARSDSDEASAADCDLREQSALPGNEDHGGLYGHKYEIKKHNLI